MHSSFILFVVVVAVVVVVVVCIYVYIYIYIFPNYIAYHYIKAEMNANVINKSKAQNIANISHNANKTTNATKYKSGMELA